MQPGISVLHFASLHSPLRLIVHSTGSSINRHARHRNDNSLMPTNDHQQHEIVIIKSAFSGSFVPNARLIYLLSGGADTPDQYLARSHPHDVTRAPALFRRQPTSAGPRAPQWACRGNSFTLDLKGTFARSPLSRWVAAPALMERVNESGREL